MAENQDQKSHTRAAVYIDGFNLYHPIHEIGEPFLKWCNLWRLSEIMCKPKGLDLQKVVFCTAVPQFNEGKRDRHNTFNTALTAHGVTILKGHHVFDETAQKHSEKQSDINVALSLILDGIDDIYDWAFLVSADSDQAATARVFSERLPNKKLVGVAPPNRRVPDKASPYFAASFVLSRDQIEEAIMPAFVPTKSGALLRRPNDYAPPAGWMHPDDRPKKKRA